MDEIQFPIDSVVVTPEISHQQRAREFDLKLYFLLLAVALLGTLAILPFSYTLMKQMDLPIPAIVVPIALAVTVLIELLLSAAMIALGLGLGRRLDMAWMFEPASTTIQPSTARRLWIRYAQPLLIGMALGAILVVVLRYVEISGANPKQAISMPDAWEGLLASIGAGIREEIWLRLGLLTFFAWLGFKVFGQATDQTEKIQRADLLDRQPAGGAQFCGHPHPSGPIAPGAQRSIAHLHLCWEWRARHRFRLALLAPGPRGRHDRPFRSRPGAQGARASFFVIAAKRGRALDGSARQEAARGLYDQ